MQTRLPALVLAAALGAHVLVAQVVPVPSPTAAAAPASDVVKLSVFEVNAANDDEYRAANTTTGTRYNTPIKDFAAKYLGQREAELITVATNTGAITIDARLVPAHYLYDFNAGYRRKIGRYNATLQLNVANLADDDKFYGAVWQTDRTYRLSAGLNF